MAFTAEAISQANQQAALSKIAESGPWVIYKVDRSDLVVPMTVQPVIVSTTSDDPKERWLEIGTSWFQHPEDWAAVPADDGPESWQKVDAKIDLNRRQGEPADPSRKVDIVKPAENISVVELEPVKISNTKLEDEAISFSVDKVGVPVLVRMSYFPNWKVENAQGPYRVAPNMMVVIPTKNNIRLHYGYTRVDFSAYFMTFVGVCTMAVRWRGRQVARRRKTARR
ncbi:MAG TPA: hypothetical protein DD711_06355 [Acidimicrobium sp.]|nr:hypothetical protein [Acidimicrobium sp.]